MIEAIRIHDTTAVNAFTALENGNVRNLVDEMWIHTTYGQGNFKLLKDQINRARNLDYKAIPGMILRIEIDVPMSPTNYLEWYSKKAWENRANYLRELCVMRADNDPRIALDFECYQCGGGIETPQWAPKKSYIDFVEAMEPFIDVMRQYKVVPIVYPGFSQYWEVMAMVQYCDLGYVGSESCFDLPFYFVQDKPRFELNFNEARREQRFWCDTLKKGFYISSMVDGLKNWGQECRTEWKKRAGPNIWYFIQSGDHPSNYIFTPAWFNEPFPITPKIPDPNAYGSVAFNYKANLPNGPVNVWTDLSPNKRDLKAITGLPVPVCNNGVMEFSNNPHQVLKTDPFVTLISDDYMLFIVGKAPNALLNNDGTFFQMSGGRAYVAQTAPLGLRWANMSIATDGKTRNIWGFVRRNGNYEVWVDGAKLGQAPANADKNKQFAINCHLSSPPFRAASIAIDEILCYDGIPSQPIEAIFSMLGKTYNIDLKMVQ